MKLVMIMHLGDDQECVERLLAERDVAVWSRLGVEGHGPGTRGWYGEVAPFASRVVLAVVSEEVANGLLEAVEECRGVQDPAHPIRAFQVDVERAAACGCESLP